MYGEDARHPHRIFYCVSNKVPGYPLDIFDSASGSGSYLCICFSFSPLNSADNGLFFYSVQSSDQSDSDRLFSADGKVFFRFLLCQGQRIKNPSDPKSSDPRDFSVFLTPSKPRFFIWRDGICIRFGFNCTLAKAFNALE